MSLAGPRRSKQCASWPARRRGSCKCPSATRSAGRRGSGSAPMATFLRLLPQPHLLPAAGPFQHQALTAEKLAKQVPTPCKNYGSGCNRRSWRERSSTKYRDFAIAHCPVLSCSVQVPIKETGTHAMVHNISLDSASLKLTQGGMYRSGRRSPRQPTCTAPTSRTGGGDHSSSSTRPFPSSSSSPG